MVLANKKWTLRQMIGAFFPFQLLIHHIKYNLLALLYWALIFMIVTDQFGSSFGIPLLFFSPEYLGEVSIWSFLTLGFAFGGFAMGFHTYSYIKLAPNFSFLTSLDHPFFKFCVNNTTIPTTFNIVFIYQFVSFQIDQEFANNYQVLEYVGAYLAGYYIFQMISFLYFFPMNSRVTRSILDPLKDVVKDNVAKTVIPNKEKWQDGKKADNNKTYLYIGKRFKIKSSRSNEHYSPELLQKIYEQNKINATIFETLSLISFISLGLFRENPYFELPAAVSIVLLLTIVLMLFSALISWLHRWTYPVLILLFLGMNYLSVHSPFFTFRNYAYGLSYSEEDRRNYDIDNMAKIGGDPVAQKMSFDNAISMLESWKERTGERRPKLILLNVSGGGSRSALWVLTCMQNLDERLNKQVSTHLQMITGASGGMVGAAYYREIMHRHLRGEIENPFDSVYRQNISADMLNRLAFAASTNDIFFRYQKVDINGHTYTKDRGLAFETQLNQNTQNLLNVPLGYYYNLEKKSEVPLMIFSPTIVNDGRRLLISSQPLNFLDKGTTLTGPKARSFENIDYINFFNLQNPLNVRFTSVMRMSATFPFVMPMVTMPTNPEIQLMDAGLRDNYGGKVTMEYLNACSDWIKKNTSGVIILQIRDTKKVLDNETYHEVSLLDKITLPFGNMYKNFPRTQSFDQDQMIEIAQSQYDFPLDVISFNMREKNKDKISLSWHLTSEEKQLIEQAFESRSNQWAFKKIKRLLRVPD